MQDIESRRKAAASKLIQMGEEFDKKRFPDVVTEWRMDWLMNSCSRMYNNVVDYLTSYVNSTPPEVES